LWYVNLPNATILSLLIRIVLIRKHKRSLYLWLLIYLWRLLNCDFAGLINEIGTDRRF
jgi:hypothetical protein